MTAVQATTEEQIQKIYDLYMEAFPKSERKPFEIMMEKQKEGAVDVLYLEEAEKFIGLAITARYEDRVLLDYFAIDKQARGGGYGSAAIRLLLEFYEGKRMILEIETPRVPCENREQRIRRKNFYHKNGLTDLDFMTKLFGVEMDMLSNGKPCTFEEYQEIYLKVFGERTRPFVLKLSEEEL